MMTPVLGPTHLRDAKTGVSIRKHLFPLGHSLIVISNANNLAPSNQDTFTHIQDQDTLTYLKIGKIRDVILYLLITTVLHFQVRSCSENLKRDTHNKGRQ